jgi:hypothetical protein
MADEDFRAAFLERRLDARDFDHRAHLRVAWLMLSRYPLEDAVERICWGIERFATHCGASEKYHRTLSEALVRIMASYGAGTSAMTCDEFTRANPELISDVRGMLARHYSPERLGSPEARQRLLAPDLSLLPPVALHRPNNDA